MFFYIAYMPKGMIINFNKFDDYSYGFYIYAFPIQQSVVSIFPEISVSDMVVFSSVLTFVMAFFLGIVLKKYF